MPNGARASSTSIAVDRRIARSGVRKISRARIISSLSDLNKERKPEHRRLTCISGARRYHLGKYRLATFPVTLWLIWRPKKPLRPQRALKSRANAPLQTRERPIFANMAINKEIFG